VFSPFYGLRCYAPFTRELEGGPEDQHPTTPFSGVVRHSKIGRPMSASGQKRTFTHLRPMSALPPEADIRSLIRPFCLLALSQNRLRIGPSVVGVDPVHGSIFNYALLACASVPVSSCRTWACRCRDAQWEKKWTFLKIFFFVWFLVIVTLLAVLLR